MYGSVTIRGTDGGRNPGVITGSQRTTVDVKATVSTNSDGSFMFSSMLACHVMGGAN